MNIEQISLIAQKISFAYEDQFFDEKKRKLFNALFSRYLQSVDPEHEMEPHDALIMLGQRYPFELEQMVKELQEKNLISD